MVANGKRRPPRPRIEVVRGTASEAETAAIVAALEQFLADTAPAPRAATTVSPWLRAALEEGISGRGAGGYRWGPAGRAD